MILENFDNCISMGVSNDRGVSNGVDRMLQAAGMPVNRITGVVAFDEKTCGIKYPKYGRNYNTLRLSNLTDEEVLELLSQGKLDLGVVNSDLLTKKDAAINRLATLKFPRFWDLANTIEAQLISSVPVPEELIARTNIRGLDTFRDRAMVKLLKASREVTAWTETTVAEYQNRRRDLENWKGRIFRSYP